MITEQNAMVSVTNLTKSFGTVVAVNDISFEVRPGEIFGLLGPNGAGKTTTVKQILGLLEQEQGEIRVFGLDPNKDDIEIKR
ncbi:MAG: ATP-binding cassette domain-containing protein, partial [Candidatus Heimdallarchaeaceae archaeon]